MVRNVVKGEFKIIEPTFDKSAKNQGLYAFLKEAVAPFGITNFKDIKSASKEGWKVYNNFHVMMRSGMDYKTALKYAIAGKISIDEPEKAGMINVALISHGYNIYDERASMKIIDKLEKMGVNVYTALQLTDEQMQEGLYAIGSHQYWANSSEMTGAAGHYLKDNKIDGIITLNSFGCGPDSLMIESITRKSKDAGKPMLSLTIDEHTGEAGFITRLEAFIDMLFRKKRSIIVNKIDIDENYIPQTNVCEKVLHK